MNEFLQRLKQRKLAQWAVAYVAAAFAAIQGIDVVAQQFGWPDGVRRGITLALVVGFFVTLVLAWYHGERGAQKLTGTELLILALLLSLGGAFLWRFANASREPAAASTGGPALTAAASPASFAPAAAIPEKSIAVLPFENLSDNKENAYFTDGVQDEILTDLAKIADLKVISRTSVMQYKSGAARNLREIGRQLGVAHLLEGSVQRVGDKVRVNTQLIDARTDAHEWAENYDRPIDDVFAIQSEISKTIADQLQAKLSPHEKSAIEQRPTTNIGAFELYSRAKDLILHTAFSAAAAQNLRTGIELLNQALALDPSFFDAYCQLAFASDSLYGFGTADHTPALLVTADAAVATAFRFRPDAGEAHLARATHLYQAYRNYDGALGELEVARMTLPNNPAISELTAAIMRRRGKHEEGLQAYQRAIQLDPRNFYTIQQLALSYAILRRYPEAIGALDRALTIKPDDPETRATRAQTFLHWKGDYRPLHQVVDEIRTNDPSAVKSIADGWLIDALAERDPAAAESAITALGDGTFGDNATQFNAGFAHALLARMMKDDAKVRAAFAAIRPEQERIVQAQPDYGPAVCLLALIDAGLGRKEQALQEIQRAVQLLPLEKDALNGADMIYYSGIVAGWVGEKDLALQNLTKAAQLPGFVTYGALKLLPWCDPLRGDPRFEKIVASLAPKTAQPNE
ncbi:MAG TPA: hypothetical protein VLI42_00725 [Chthoniobacterales bacterium]|nr:hypothetical protein [Chthoniobacterales bacterium]